MSSEDSVVTDTPRLLRYACQMCYCVSMLPSISDGDILNVRSSHLSFVPSIQLHELSNDMQNLRVQQ